MKTSHVLTILTAATLTQVVQAQKAQQKYGCSSEVPAAKVFIQDTATPTRGLADNYYLWDNGKTLVVKFLSGSKAMQDKVKTIAKEWEQHANIKFEFVTIGAAHIRINLDDKGGHNSAIGTLATSIPQDERTMNFDTTDFKTYTAMRRTVLHEFGHAIGLLHEHYSPVAGIPWNKEAVYTELKRTQGWNKETVDANLFQQYNVSYTNGTQYDRKSIMHYPVFARWTTNNYSVDWNNDLSQGDIAMVTNLYPRNKDRENEVPRFNVSNFSHMNVVNSETKQGVSIFPSFKLNTTGKQARVYYIAFFYDENGEPIKKETETYNINNVTATFKTAVVPAGKIIATNQQANKDFELFIPYSELPTVVKGKNNLQIEFRIYLMDDNKELKILYQSKRKVFNFIKA